MATNTTSQFKINGVIDTNNNVLENINILATASGCFVTYDPIAGQWSVIINKTGTSVASFNNTNIIGGINVNGSGINELYNSASIEFPNKDAKDTRDYVDIEIPTADRFDNENDNTLEIKLDCINDPIQAGLIASRELKQSRVDKVISFTTNFLGNGIKAGDIIDVTADSYAYSAKLFRVLSVEEQDDDEGNILIGITALEYDENVYDTTGLIRSERSKKTGITPKIKNTAIQTSEDVNIGKQIGRLLIGNAAASLLRNILSVDEETGVLTNDIAFQDENLQSLMESFAAPPVTASASSDFLCEGSSITVTSDTDCSSCFFSNPSFTYDYTITGVTVGSESSASEINAKIDGEDVGSEGTIPLGSSITLTAIDGNVTTQKTITVTIGNSSTNITLYPSADSGYEVTASSGTITEGDSVDITVTTTGVADGTAIPYTISGSATSKVTSPALTGTVTINSNTGSVTIVTADDNVYNATQSLTFTIAPTGITPTPCGTFDFDATVSVLNNGTTGPQPDPDFECEYAQVPIVWCGVFDGTTQYLKSVNVRQYAYLPVAPSGGVAVPTTVSVSDPGTASAAINITNTINVEPGGIGAGGAQIDVITSFDPAPSGGDTLITGTVTTLTGYWL